MDEVKNAKLCNFLRTVREACPYDVKVKFVRSNYNLSACFPAAERDLAKRIKPIRNWMKRHTFQTTIYLLNIIIKTPPNESQ